MLNDLLEKERESFLKIADKITLDNDEVLIRMGENSDCFYFIISGEVEVYIEPEFVINVLKDGKCIGFMGVVERKKRSASVRATKNTKLYKIYAEDFESLRKSKERDLYIKIIKIQMLESIGHVRNNNTHLLHKYNQLVKAKNEKITYGALFISVIISIIFYGFTLRIFLSSVTSMENTTLFTSVILFVFGGLIFSIVYRSPFPISDFGINLRRWKLQIYESLWYTTLFIILITICKLAYLYFMGDADDSRLFTLPLLNTSNISVSVLLSFVYCIFVVVQEFIARGVIISTILNFLEGVKHSGLGAIIISSMLFSAQHLHLPSIAFAVLVFIPGIFWGWLFVRHRSILGVSISHIITGIWAIQILGLDNIGIPQF